MTDPKPAVVCAIDGTLALRTEDGRGPYDWDRVDEDHPNTPVVAAVTALHRAGHPIVLVSGRKLVCYDLTVEWLKKHVPFVDYELHMRADHDNRPDADVKRDIHRDHLTGLDILCVFDDRDQTVALFRDELGLPTFQVAHGDF